MFEQLSEYLGDNATPEQMALVIRACQLLSEVNCDKHINGIDLELRQSDMEGNDVVLKIIDNVLKPVYKDLLAEFGVKVIPESKLDQLINALEGLYAILNFDDPLTLNDLSRIELDPVEVLCTILAVVQGTEEEFFYEFLEDVPSELIKRISQETYKQVQDLDEDSTVVDTTSLETIQARFLKLKALYSTTEFTVVDTALKEGTRLGTPLQPLLDRYLNLLESFPAVQLPLHLYSLLTISDVPTDRLVLVAKHELDNLLFNPNDITAAYNVLKQVHAKVTQDA